MNQLKTQTLQIEGMDCGSCAKTIEASLQQLRGVTVSSVSFASGKAKVSYDAQQISEAEVIKRITALGYKVDVAATEKLNVQISGMDCGSCAKTIQIGVEEIAGVSQALVSFATGRLEVSYDPAQTSNTIIIDRIKALGYGLEEITQDHSHDHNHDCDHEHDHEHHHSKPKPNINSDFTNWKFWITNRRGQSVIVALVGLALGLISQYSGLPIWVGRGFYGVGIVAAGYPVAKAGLFELRLRRADMNLLMTISVIGAVILGDWLEAALVVFLFALGTTLQIFTFSRTRNAINALMSLTPATAVVKRGNKEVTVGVESVWVGEIFTIRPGQRVALDGVVVSGSSDVNQSAITGESLPEFKISGDKVFAGTLNQTGFLEVKVTHTANDSSFAKIIKLVEQAQESRAPSQQWVDKFATVYTPIVILSAIAIALIGPLAFAQPWSIWFYRALVMLVIACPCALVISTPVSIVSAIGAASRKGILFKGGKALETAGKLKVLAFDKTGTITQGSPILQKIYSFTENISTDASTTLTLQIAASIEKRSEHPLAKAIVEEAENRGIELQIPSNLTAIPGKGIQAELNHSLYLVGNQRLFADFAIPLSEKVKSVLTEIESLGQTPVLVGTKEEILAAIALADGVRLEAAETMRQLKRVGLKELVMLTGDRTIVAKQIAQQVGITEYYAELLPEHKLDEIRRLRSLGVVGMVGDGINDTPALAAADIGFAIGNIDIALETADVVLMASDLRKLAYAIDLSQRTVSVIKQNVVFSLVTKVLFLILASFGFVGLAIAVLADTGSSLLVTANGMRLYSSRSN